MLKGVQGVQIVCKIAYVINGRPLWVVHNVVSQLRQAHKRTIRPIHQNERLCGTNSTFVYRPCIVVLIGIPFISYYKLKRYNGKLCTFPDFCGCRIHQNNVGKPKFGILHLYENWCILLLQDSLTVYISLFYLLCQVFG